MDCSTSGVPVRHHLPEFVRFKSIESQMLSNHLISAAPFSVCFQSFPESASFPMSQLFASGGDGIIASASASVLPIKTQGWFPLGLTGLISLQSKGLPRVWWGKGTKWMETPGKADLEHQWRSITFPSRTQQMMPNTVKLRAHIDSFKRVPLWRQVVLKAQLSAPWTGPEYKVLSKPKKKQEEAD